jgi:hypothetical protein
MANITLRVNKANPLTITEVDANFTNLNNDKLEVSQFTSANILTKLKEVDGSASGLDAALLRGLLPETTNTISSIVQRDASGNFAAGTITAALNGNASTVTNGVVITGTYSDPTWLTISQTKVGLSNVTNESKATMFTDPTFTGIPLAPTAGTDTNSEQIATTEFVKTAISNAYSLPPGIIMLWSGAANAIPTGFALCNGQTVNGYTTPNLTNRFVVGAGIPGPGPTYSVGATGGSADAVVVQHGHTATSTDSGHTHGYDRAGGALPQSGNSTNCLTNPAATHPNTDTGVANITTTITETGVSGTNANLPPYYALCYIMKIV